jgi:hypothetical protein
METTEQWLPFQKAGARTPCAGCASAQGLHLVTQHHHSDVKCLYLCSKHLAAQPGNADVQRPTAGGTGTPFSCC